MKTETSLNNRFKVFFLFKFFNWLWFIKISFFKIKLFHALVESFSIYFSPAYPFHRKSEYHSPISQTVRLKSRILNNIHILKIFILFYISTSTFIWIFFIEKFYNLIAIQDRCHQTIIIAKKCLQPKKNIFWLYIKCKVLINQRIWVNQ